MAKLGTKPSSNRKGSLVSDHGQEVRNALSRADVLTTAMLAGAGVAAGGALLAGLADGAASQPSRKQDVEILNFGLLLEELQAAFYADALQRGSLTGELRQFAEQVGAQEEEHADLVRKALGDDARRPPAFDFGDATADAKSFGRTARELEDLGVAAYNTQAPNLTKEALGAAARIVSVEARHAAWIRDLLGENPAPFASEPRASAEEVTKALNRTGFLG
jgi:rubrerythrin